jgi:threonine/homoserine/homoserine lactone efflux protein
MELFTLNYLIKGILAGLLVSMPLGPIGVVLIQRTMNKGFASGIISGLGVATADTLFAIIASFGLTFITNFFIKEMTAFTVIGSIILFVMGIRMFKSNPAQYFNASRKIEGNNQFSDFISMFLLTITNPMTVFIFGTVFTILGLGILHDDRRSALIVTIGIYFGATLWWLILSSGINLFRHKINLKSLHWLNRITGTVIIIIAFGIIGSLFLIF